MMQCNKALQLNWYLLGMATLLGNFIPSGFHATLIEDKDTVTKQTYIAFSASEILGYMYSQFKRYKWKLYQISKSGLHTF